MTFLWFMAYLSVYEVAALTTLIILLRDSGRRVKLKEWLNKLLDIQPEKDYLADKVNSLQTDVKYLEGEYYDFNASYEKETAKLHTRMDEMQQYFGQYLAGIDDAMKLRPTVSDVQAVVEAITSLEASLETRLTPVAPKKGSRAKLKVLKKGK